MTKHSEAATFALPEGAGALPCLFELPDREPQACGMLELETELIADQPEAEPMPSYIQDMFEVAGVPRSMRAGESLQWFNGCKTSVKYESASAKVHTDASWFELVIVHQSGRGQRLRCTRYGDLVALEDSAGVDANGMIQNTMAGMLLDFCAATRQLMVKH